MKLWGLTFTILGFALAQSAQIPKCPTFCECVVTGEATCTTLDIEPFPTPEIVKLIIKSPKEPLDLTGATFTKLRLTKLRELLIENATITKLDSTLFTTIHLEQFVVRHSKIPLVNKQLFKPAQYLRQVDLSYSTITNFHGIHSAILDELVLAGCGLKSLPAGGFNMDDLPALTYLSLEDNLLEEVKLGELSGAHINLSGNKITQLTITPDEDLEMMVTLRLDRNPLNTIDVQDEVEIEQLYVRDCSLTNLNFMRNLTALTKLDATNNLISKLDPTILDDLYMLEVLDLTQNRINELPKDLRKPISLTSFILDKNNINKLTEIFFQGALTRFSCNSCNLTEVHPNTFLQMQGTKVISLADNRLTSLPEVLFKPVFAMSKLDLSHNKLTSLPAGIFRKNVDLKTVDLSANPLNEVDPAIFSSTVLQELHMNSCGLKKLWPTTKAVLPKLETLIATHNNITKLSQEDLKVIPKISLLNIQDNPLACTDENINVIGHLSNLNAQFLHPSNCEQIDSIYDDFEADSDYTDPEVLDDKSLEITPKKIDDVGNDLLQNYEDANDDDEDEDDDDDDDSDDSDETDEQEIDLDEGIKPLPKDVTIPTEGKTYKEQNLDDFVQDAEDVNAIEYYKFQARQRSSKQMLLFVLPTLVFVLTAMVVLLLTVTVILCVMQKRNGRPTNAPQITILPWGNSQKIKKHSGSIYRPLSEEKIPV